MNLDVRFIWDVKPSLFTIRRQGYFQGLRHEIFTFHRKNKKIKKKRDMKYLPFMTMSL